MVDFSSFSSQPQIISTKNNIICGQQPQQQSSQSKAKTVTQNQRQQQQVKQTNTNISPPSTERTGPEGEADEEEPSEVWNMNLYNVVKKGSKLHE